MEDIVNEVKLTTKGGKCSDHTPEQHAQIGNYSTKILAIVGELVVQTRLCYNEYASDRPLGLLC